MGFSRQEHWSGLPFPSPKGTIERKKVKSLSHVQLFATPWTADSLPAELPGKPYLLCKNDIKKYVSYHMSEEIILEPIIWSASLYTVPLWRRKWQPTPVFLPGESQGQGSLVGCHLWGRTELDTTEVT